MDRHQFTPEDREGQVAELTEQLLADWNRKLAAGDKLAATDLQNTVLDRLTEADAAALFIQALSDQAGADARFASLVTGVMLDRCEAEAENAVNAMERARAASRADSRIERATWSRAA